MTEAPSLFETAGPDLAGNVAAVLPRARGLYWGGRWHDSSDGNRLLCLNPSMREPIGETFLASPADVDAAVQAARKAFPEWAERRRWSGRAACAMPRNASAHMQRNWH